jgi:hypothetical protein
MIKRELESKHLYKSASMKMNIMKIEDILGYVTRHNTQTPNQEQSKHKSEVINRDDILQTPKGLKIKVPSRNH